MSSLLCQHSAVRQNRQVSGVGSVGVGGQKEGTHLRAQRLEARQGADGHALVIHAATLGTGHHVHEVVHLGCGAVLAAGGWRGHLAQRLWDPSSSPFLPSLFAQEPLGSFSYPLPPPNLSPALHAYCHQFLVTHLVVFWGCPYQVVLPETRTCWGDGSSLWI